MNPPPGTHIFVFGVGRLEDVIAKGNPWYVRAYEEGFERVTFAYPIGKHEPQHQGRTWLISLGTGRQRDWLFAPWRLYKLAKELKPTTYMTADQWYAWWTGLLLRWLLGAKVVLLPVSMPDQLYADHGATITGYPYFIDRLLQRLSFATSSYVWTSAAFGSFVEWLSNDRRAKDKLIITPSLAEAQLTEPFRALKPVKRDRGEKFRIIYVGRLHPEKLVDHLIRMFALLLPKDYELVIVGDGSARGDLEALATKLNVRDRVEFKGALPNDQIPAILQSCDVFASTLTGSSLREAALAGLPIVVYDRDWVHGLFVHEENALLCPSGGLAQMARNIERLRADPELADRLATNARQLAEELWTMKNVRASLIQMATTAV